MKRVLVIDDELTIGELIKDYLDEVGYRTFVAMNAAAGLKLLEKEKPDLILLDVLMPETGGLECLRRIKERQPDSLVIMMSALQDEQIAKQAIRRGAFDYITKPFDLNYLHDQILARIFPEESA